MRYVFGPVPSRRLGQSLGVDPIPLKTCNWNCVYCQLGRTMPMTQDLAETWVKPPDDEGLMRALAILGEVAHVVHPIEGRFDLSGCDSVATAVIEIITRHPMRHEELDRALAAWDPGQVEATLASLAANEQVQIIERLGTKFWSVASSHYPSEAHSQAAKPKNLSSA